MPQRDIPVFVSSYRTEVELFKTVWDVPVLTIAIGFAVLWITVCFTKSDLTRKIAEVFYTINEKKLMVGICLFVVVALSILNYALNDGRSSWLDGMCPTIGGAACVGGFFTFGLLFHESGKKVHVLLSLLFLGVGVLIKPCDMVLAGCSLVIASLIVYRKFSWIGYARLLAPQRTYPC